MNTLAFSAKSDPVTLAMDRATLLAALTGREVVEGAAVVWERPVALPDPGVDAREPTSTDVPARHGVYTARVSRVAPESYRCRVETSFTADAEQTRGPQQEFFGEAEAHAWAIATLHAAYGDGRLIRGRLAAPPVG